METNSVMESTGAIAPVKPEWLRIPDAIRACGIGRSTLYKAIAEGSIKSVCLRQRNRERGIRLINSPSLHAYIESFLSGDGSAK
jgi:hypothetical protein